MGWDETMAKEVTLGLRPEGWWWWEDKCCHSGHWKCQGEFYPHGWTEKFLNSHEKVWKEEQIKKLKENVETTISPDLMYY